jgi:hypothetical protein
VSKDAPTDATTTLYSAKSRQGLGLGGLVSCGGPESPFKMGILFWNSSFFEHATAATITLYSAKSSQGLGLGGLVSCGGLESPFKMGILFWNSSFLEQHSEWVCTLQFTMYIYSFRVDLVVQGWMTDPP